MKMQTDPQSKEKRSTRQAVKYRANFQHAHGLTSSGNELCSPFPAEVKFRFFYTYLPCCTAILNIVLALKKTSSAS